MPIYSLTSVKGKRRYGVTRYRWCPICDRIHELIEKNTEVIGIRLLN